jgi:hypothetical protein
MLGIIIKNVVMLSVVMLNVIAPLSQPASLTLSSIEWKFFVLMRTKTYFSLKQIL